MPDADFDAGGSGAAQVLVGEALRIAGLLVQKKTMEMHYISIKVATHRTSGAGVSRAVCSV
jgi:hypothetical protein